MSEDEVAVALVRDPAATVSEADVIEYCRRNMAYFMAPRYLKFVTTLPRTLTQKVEKYQLKTDAEANPGRWWDRVAAGIVISRDGGLLRLGLIQGDNGRVIGYDSAHGIHHRHYKGKVEAIKFESFEDVENRFEADWTAFRRKGKK